MWMLGAVLGLIAGAGAGGFGGAFAGLAIGGLGGWVLQEIVKSQVARQSGEIEAKIKHIYDGLGDIHFRLKALEDANAAGCPKRFRWAPARGRCACRRSGARGGTAGGGRECRTRGRPRWRPT